MALHQRLKKLLSLPETATEDDVLRETEAALRERDVLALKVVDLLIEQTEVEKQRQEAIELLRRAAELHLD